MPRNFAMESSEVINTVFCKYILHFSSGILHDQNLTSRLNVSFAILDDPTRKDIHIYEKIISFTKSCISC